MSADDDNKVSLTGDLVETLSTLSTDLLEVQQLLDSTEHNEALKAPRQELEAIGEAIRTEVSNLADMLGEQVLTTLRDAGVEVDETGNVTDPAVLAMLEQLLAASGGQAERLGISLEDSGDGSAAVEVNFRDDEG